MNSLLEKISSDHKLISNLRSALRSADAESKSATCLGCGRDRDMSIDQHKADCLIYNPDGTVKNYKQR